MLKQHQNVSYQHAVLHWKVFQICSLSNQLCMHESYRWKVDVAKRLNHVRTTQFQHPHCAGSMLQQRVADSHMLPRGLSQLSDRLYELH